MGHIVKLRPDDRDTCGGIVTVAKSQGLWVYDPTTKEWFTPEEFDFKYNGFFSGHPVFKTVELRDPMEGFNAGCQRLADQQKVVIDLQNKVLMFARKLLQYWRNYR